MCKVSVIIPVYNAASTLEATLLSIQNQSLQDIEIICVDDGSTDDSKKVIDRIAQNDNRIRYLYQDNSGAAIARNRGLRNASGDYVAFIDADDFYPNNYALERLFEVVTQQQMNICGGSVKCDSVDKPCDEKMVFREEGTIQFIDYQFDFLFFRFIYLRSFLLKNQIEFPNLRVYEDPVFLLKAMISAREFYVIPDEVYQYTGSHQSHSMTIIKTKDYIKGVTEALSITADYQLEELHRMIFKRLEQEVCHYAGAYLYTEDDEIFRLMIAANSAIERKMIGLEHDYVLPGLLEVWRASYKYMKLRNVKIFKVIRKIFRKESMFKKANCIKSSDL